MCFRADESSLRLLAPYNGDPKSVLLNLRVLETLPSLTELDLTFHSSINGLEEEIAVTMGRLHNLRKITLRIIPSDSVEQHRFRWLRQALAHNPHLNHLDLLHLDSEGEQLIPISDLFEDIPPDHPLQLQYIRFSPFFYRITPIVTPHIHSLTSVDVCFPYHRHPHPMDDVWQILHAEGILVSDIKTNRVTQDMLNYLHILPNLTSLSLYDLDTEDQQRNRDSAKSLLPILARHSKSLRRLRFEPYNWGHWFLGFLCESPLLLCTKLEEFVLHYLDASKKSREENKRDIVGNLPPTSLYYPDEIDFRSQYPALYLRSILHSRLSWKATSDSTIGLSIVAEKMTVSRYKP